MKSITLSFLLFTTIILAQKKYHFDYAIEYEKTFILEDSATKKMIYLTNSKDNSYYVMLTERDSLNYRLLFWHHDNRHSDVLVKKEELPKSEFINLDCDNTRSYKNPFKKVAEQYDCEIIIDTIINEKKYSAYKFKSNLKLKKRIRKGAGTNVYIIDEHSKFHLPILIHPTEYEKWKHNKLLLPKGIFKEKKHITPKGEEHSSVKLINFVKIDKYILIPKDCSNFD